MPIGQDDHGGYSLCERCRGYDLGRRFFPSSLDSGLLRDIGGPKTDLPWTAFSNSKRCAFCEAVLKSLVIQPEFKKLDISKPSSGEVYGINFTLVNTGKVNWKDADTEEPGSSLENPGWSRDGDTCRRSVRHLMVQGVSGRRTSGEPLEVGGQAMVTSYLHPYYNDTRNSRDRILLSRDLSVGGVNLKLPKLWMAACANGHRRTCGHQGWAATGTAQLRMIDTEAQCVTTVTESVSYFALSYCWGSRPFLRLTRDNKATLCIKGSISDAHEEIPTTIKDAIHLTKQLGARYLWVDALCILQDDAADKEAQLPLMDKIYKGAMLTIVAASGDDAWSGIPGIGQTVREVKQFHQRVGNISLYSRAPQSTRSDLLGKSSWSKRAWTLQEHMLSSRLLIFTPTEMFWECDCELWDEGAAYESIVFPLTVVELENQMQRMQKPFPGIDPFQEYALVRNQASARQLTYELDRINCVRGLMEDMSKDLPGGFLWGLPVDMFDSSLLFADGVYQEAPHERRDGFPTWTWAGWETVFTTQVASPYDSGFGNYHEANKTLYGKGCLERPEWLRRKVAWFTLDADEWKEIQSTWISSDGSLFFQKSLEKWEQQTPKDALTIAKKRFSDAEIPFSHVLAFWTQTVHLQVDRENLGRSQPNMIGLPGGGGGSCNGFPIRDHQKRIVGFINLTEEYRAAQPDRLYFILMAQHRRWASKVGPLLDLLHVETVNNITYRVQVVGFSLSSRVLVESGATVGVHHHGISPRGVTDKTSSTCCVLNGRNDRIGKPGSWKGLPLRSKNDIRVFGVDIP